jgi:hypothetical protein
MDKGPSYLKSLDESYCKCTKNYPLKAKVGFKMEGVLSGKILASKGSSLGSMCVGLIHTNIEIRLIQYL